MCYFAFFFQPVFIQFFDVMGVLSCALVDSLSAKIPKRKMSKKGPGRKTHEQPQTKKSKRKYQTQGTKDKSTEKTPKRNIPNEISQANISHPCEFHEHEIPIERPQRKGPKRKRPNGKSQVVDPKGKPQKEHTDDVTCWFYLKPISHIGSQTYRPSAPESHHVLLWQYENLPIIIRSYDNKTKNGNLFRYQMARRLG